MAPCYYADAGFTQVYGKSGGTWSLPNSGKVYWNPTAKGYRLPTEAEWEYAARGGSATNICSGSNNVAEVAWYDSNSGGKSQPVKGKSPNGYQLYDMSGNVFEWVWDWYGNYPSSPDTDPTGPSGGTYPVIRGGSWAFPTGQCRSASRNIDNPGNRNIVVGFRLVLVP